MWWMEPVGKLIRDSVLPSYFTVWHWWTCMNMHEHAYHLCSMSWRQCNIASTFLLIGETVRPRSFFLQQIPKLFLKEVHQLCNIVLIFTDTFPQCPVFSFIKFYLYWSVNWNMLWAQSMRGSCQTLQCMAIPHWLQNSTKKSRLSTISM